MQSLLCVLASLLLGSGVCSSRGISIGPEKSKVVRIAGRTDEWGHRGGIGPLEARRREETKTFHWQTHFLSIPRQDRIPAKMWMTVPDKASISNDVQVRDMQYRRYRRAAGLVEHTDMNVTESQAGTQH